MLWKILLVENWLSNFTLNFCRFLFAFYINTYFSLLLIHLRQRKCQEQIYRKIVFYSKTNCVFVAVNKKNIFCCIINSNNFCSFEIKSGKKNKWDWFSCNKDALRTKVSSISIGKWLQLLRQSHSIFMCSISAIWFSFFWFMFFIFRWNLLSTSCNNWIFNVHDVLYIFLAILDEEER